MSGRRVSDMRDRDIIDAELRLLAAVRWSMVKWARDEMRRLTQLTERLITLPAAEGPVAAVPFGLPPCCTCRPTRTNGGHCTAPAPRRRSHM